MLHILAIRYCKVDAWRTILQFKTVFSAGSLNVLYIEPIPKTQ